MNSKQLPKMLSVSWGLRQYPERKLFVIWSQNHLSKKRPKAKRKTLVDSIDESRGQEPTLQVAPSYDQQSGHHLADEQIKQTMYLGSIVFHCNGIKCHIGLRVLKAPGIKSVCYKVKACCVKKWKTYFVQRQLMHHCKAILVAFPQVKLKLVILGVVDSNFSPGTYRTSIKYQFISILS